MKQPQKPSKPYRPSKPEEPKKTYTFNSVVIDRVELRHDTKLVDVLKKIINIDNLDIDLLSKITIEDDMYDCGNSLYFVIRGTGTTENVNYEKDLKNHKKKLKAYEKKMEAYKEKIKIWEEKNEIYLQELEKYQEYCQSKRIEALRKELESLEKKVKK